jgi:membrane fusion protein (multidrug efflux system)
MKSPSLRAPALCLGLLALTACGKKEQGPPQMPPPQVGVVAAQPQNEPLTKDLVGRLSAFRSADVRARVSGVLLKRTYVEGSDVKKGQLMFEIDPAPYQAALNSSLANLAAAKATYTNAHVAAERDRKLITQGYISQAQLDNDEASERTAAAAVKQAQASVDTARINLGYTKVVSPIDGRSGQQQLTEGAIVGNGTADTGASSTLLTTVSQIDPLYVNFTMSVADMEQLRQAQNSGGVTLAQPDQASVQVTLPDGSTYAEPGTLDFTSVTVDPSTGAVSMRALIPNPKRSLLPGMYVTLKAKLGEQHKVFLVPQPAVLRDPAGAYVFVVGQDGKVKRHDVATSGMSGSNWVVTSGLAAGDQVVVSGVQNVRDGAPAKASPWQPQPASGGSAPAAGK